MRTTTPHSFKRRTFLLGALAAGASAKYGGAFAGERYQQVEGSGNITRQARDAGHFTGVAMALAGKVEVRRGERDSIVVEADDNLLALIETAVEDGTLQIRTRHAVSIRTYKLRVLVTVRQLDRLALAGSGDIDVDRMDGARVRFDIGGTGTIRVGKVDAERIVVGVGGSGNLRVEGGTARTVSISVGGSGDIDLARVRTESANVTIAGSGDATVWVRDSLSTTVMGSGSIGYYGDPRVARSMMGSGSVRRLGATPG
ncbi:head GIN domain-containing protein [Massilia sp. 9096]|uniref:head GIN domain-containing protein n=1 Tax=Massilia sp. 9096 TaxID=1500894 RepID=UPI000565843D|nr:head GIN domain-containing protein [Massilia sp. 9096]